MKIKLFVIMAFFSTSVCFGQSSAITQGGLVLKALKEENYAELSKMTSPTVSKVLTPEVFFQIREVFIRKNDQPNRYIDQGKKDSISVLAMKMIKDMSKIPEKAEVGTEKFEITQQGADTRVVKGAITKTGLNLVMEFNDMNKLTAFYLEPVHGVTKYTDPSYSAPSLFSEKPILVKTGPFLLPGTLTVPTEKKSFPILVFIHGSGQGDRDAGIAALKPFRDLAIGLAAKGIATLRYDKRTRIYPHASAPLGKIMTIAEETTQDARSAIKLAMNIPGAKKVYLLGHSMGGMMTPEIMLENPELSGAVIFSGPARKMDLSFIDQIKDSKDFPQDFKTGKIKELLLVKHADTIKDQSKILSDQTVAFWIGLNKYNQLDMVKKVSQPLLILQGGSDYMVPSSDLELWKDAVKDKKNAIAKCYPGLNHFYSEHGERLSGYDYYIPGNVPEYVIGDISSWILKH